MITDSRGKMYLGTIRELMELIKARKSYWLAPVIFALLLVAALGLFLEGNVLAPAIYSIF